MRVLTMSHKEIEEAVDSVLSKLRAARSDKFVETSHISADRALEEFLNDLGFREVVDAFDKVEKWYP